jgi:hypothetical protein
VLAHRLHDDLYGLPLSASELATLLHCDPGYLDPADPSVTIGLLRRLPWNELDYLSTYLATTPKHIAAALTSPRLTPPGRHSDTDVLSALLTHAGQPGLPPETIAETLNWTLRRVHTAAQRLRDSPTAEPTRLTTTVNGHLALRADPRLLPAQARATITETGSPPHGFSLDAALATSLWLVLYTEHDGDIPLHHRRVLTNARLITTTDTEEPKVTADVAFSLSDHPACHPDMPAAIT